MYEKCGSILFSKAIMRERLRWLQHVMQMKLNRLPKIVLFVQPSRANCKAGCPRLGKGGCQKERFKKNRNILGGCKEGSFEHTGMEEERA